MKSGIKKAAQAAFLLLDIIAFLYELLYFF